MADSNTTPSQAAIAEIDHGPSKLDQFLDKHTSKLIIVAILVALGMVAYVIKSGLDEDKSQKAGAALVAANTNEELEGVVNQWAGSNSAASALPLIAKNQWSDNKDASVATLETFINNHPEHTAVATSKVSLAIKLLKQSKADQATEILTEVADSDTSSYIAPLAAILLGDIAKEAGDTKLATTWYKKAQEDQAEQGNTFAPVAKIRELLVSAQAPVMVKPALPEPTAPAPTEAAATPTVPATPEIPAIPATPEAAKDQ